MSQPIHHRTLLSVAPPHRTWRQRIYQRVPILNHAPVVGVTVMVGLITFLVQGYRLGVAPDVLQDEGYYIQVANNLARGVGLVGIGRPVYLDNPPGYLLLEAAYIRLAGLTNTDLLTTVLSTRYLNIFFSAVTASLLMLFGHKLHSYGAGLVIAALFIMDPYVQRINRRSMLETLAMLCVLFGMYMFFTRQPHLTRLRRLGAGIAFGLAMLTKEAMALELFTLIAYAACFRRNQLRDAVWVTVTACAIVLPYPVWALIHGQGNTFLSVKWDQFSRIPSAIINLVGGTSPAPGSARAHSLQNFLILLPQYWTSYLLIGFSAIFTAVLILRLRRLTAASYLITWSVISFGVVCALGLVSDQYFYYLIVPCMVMSGYVIGLIVEGALHSQLSTKISTSGWPPLSASAITRYRRVWTTILAVFVAMQLYNSYEWVADYATGYDDAYIEAIQYVTSHIRAGATIVITEGSGMAAFLPNYELRYDQDPNVVVDRHERYFIMSSKSIGYGGNIQGGTTKLFYSWVVQNSRPLFVREDLSRGTVGVYLRIDQDPNVVVDRHERYFIMSSKSIGYGGNIQGGTTKLFYSWVVQNSRPLFVREARSYWTPRVYERKPDLPAKGGYA